LAADHFQAVCQLMQCCHTAAGDSFTHVCGTWLCITAWHHQQHYRRLSTAVSMRHQYDRLHSKHACTITHRQPALSESWRLHHQQRCCLTRQCLPPAELLLHSMLGAQYAGQALKAQGVRHG
jgi:hypothetical protein